MAEKEKETNSHIDSNLHKDQQPINQESEKEEQKIKEEVKVSLEKFEGESNQNLDPNKIEVEEIKVTKTQLKGRKKTKTNLNNNCDVNNTISNNEPNEKKQVELNKNTSVITPEEENQNLPKTNESPNAKIKNSRKKTKKQIAEDNVKLTEVFKSDKEELSQEENKICNPITSTDSVKLDLEILESENIKDITNIKKRSKSKSKENTPLPLNEDLPCFINLSDLNNQTMIQNSDMIKAIMEICYHSQNYGISIPNNTREFWKKVYENPEWDNILKKFQSETLRKYWRTIRDTNQPLKIIELIETYNINFDANNVKLLPVINSISLYIESNSSSFDPFLKGLVSTNSGPKKEKKENEVSLARKRRRDDGIEEDVKQISKIMGSEYSEKKKKIIYDEDDEDEDFTVKNYKNEPTSSSIKKRPPRKAKQITVDLTGDDLNDCENIDDIVNVFKSNFQQKNPEEILDSLHKTSFNLTNTYLILKEPNLFKNLAFEEPDDRTIKFLDNSNTYKKLLNVKGQELMEERRKFLQI